MKATQHPPPHYRRERPRQQEKGSAGQVCVLRPPANQTTLPGSTRFHFFRGHVAVWRSSVPNERSSTGASFTRASPRSAMRTLPASGHALKLPLADAPGEPAAEGTTAETALTFHRDLFLGRGDGRGLHRGLFGRTCAMSIVTPKRPCTTVKKEAGQGA